MDTTVQEPTDTARDLTARAELDALRVQTLLTIAVLCTTAGLPAPSDVKMEQHDASGTRSLRLVVGRNNEAGVRAWAAHVGLARVEHRSSKGGGHRWVKAQALPPDPNSLRSRLAEDGVLWLGWHDVEVLSFLDEPAPEQVAAAVLTPDAGNLPQWPVEQAEAASPVSDRSLPAQVAVGAP